MSRLVHDRAPAPTGLRPPPVHAPQRLRTRQDLRTLQRLMTHALVRPLADDDTLAPQWHDGRPTAAVVAEFIKPNARLTAMERLQIYARCYWYRTTESVFDDSPGLRALLGDTKFARLVQAYLTQYPSRSFTLRNLCARLPQFIAEEPRWTSPRTPLAHAIARFEWAQTHGFDAASRSPLRPEDIASAPPSRLRLALQPHISLLDMDWPVDTYVIAVKQREAQRAEASNTVAGARVGRRLRQVARPRKKRTCIVVHRYKHRLYYKRVSPEGFAILTALQAGRTLAEAIAQGGPRVTPEAMREWFSTWMELGWFCRRETKRGRRE